MPGALAVAGMKEPHRSGVHSGKSQRLFLVLLFVLLGLLVFLFSGQQLNHADLRPIPLSVALLDDPEIPPLSIQVSVFQFVKDLVRGRLFLQVGEGLTPCVEISSLGQRNNLFCNRSEFLCLGFGCLNLLMLYNSILLLFILCLFVKCSIKPKNLIFDYLQYYPATFLRLKSTAHLKKVHLNTFHFWFAIFCSA